MNLSIRNTIDFKFIAQLILNTKIILLDIIVKY